jgi:methionyl-tRNA formyltransferase
VENSLQIEQVGPRIALFAAGKTGLSVAKFLSNPDTLGKVCFLFLSGVDEETDQKISKALALAPEFVFSGKSAFSEPNVRALIQEEQLDFAVSVYWPWIISPDLLAAFKETLNFHPALLPRNRGWYPHVFNLIENSAAGVSLHRMVSSPDAGDLWAQREVSILPTDTATDLYLRLQEAIEGLFFEYWGPIAKGEIEPVAQDHTLATYNPKASIEDLDFIDVEASFTGGDLIRLLKARTFGGYGFAYYLDEDGQKVFVRINLSRSPRFF